MTRRYPTECRHEKPDDSSYTNILYFFDHNFSRYTGLECVGLDRIMTQVAQLSSN